MQKSVTRWIVMGGQDDDVAAVVQRLQESDALSEHNRQLLLSFKDWLLEHKPDDAAVFLFAWYLFADRISFELDDVSQERTAALMSDVPEEHRDLCDRAIKTFYEAFRPTSREP